ncbi:MAG: hypothetical protein ACRCUT_06760 [Spirochaetota bacterium]
MKSIKSLALNTCIDSCNGMCRRVLEDAKKLYPDESDLVEAYLADKVNGGRNFTSIIELGLLLKKIEDKI